ncbi:hypothetical protein [Burkholderia sp. RS02]|uniref:hypothetical protein n=1 Tax=unclassified Burkholderia TaxID=2613784 RepID=UPI0032188B80
MYSFRNRLRNKSGLSKFGVNFLSVENDLMSVLPSGNDGGIGQGFVFFGSSPRRANTSKDEVDYLGYRRKISLIFNRFRGEKNNFGVNRVDWGLSGGDVICEM